MRTIDKLAADLGKIEDDNLRTHIHRTWSFAEIYSYRHLCLAGGNMFDFSLHQVPVFSTPRAKHFATTFDLEITACVFALGKIAKIDKMIFEDNLKKTPAELQAEAKTQISIPDQLDKILKLSSENYQGIAVLVQHLPDATRPTTISWNEAVGILNRLGGEATERTIRNWLKSGRAAKTGTPIAWDNLKTTTTWEAWCETFVDALRSRITCRKIVSAYAGKVAQERSRRRK